MIDTVSYSIPVVLKLENSSESPRGLIKAHTAWLHTPPPGFLIQEVRRYSLLNFRSGEPEIERDQASCPSKIGSL